MRSHVEQVKVLSISISDEHPNYIIANAYKIVLPVTYIASLAYAAGFPSMNDYAFWDDVNDQIGEQEPYATATFLVEADDIAVLLQQIESSKFTYDPDVIAAGEAHDEDLAINFAIEQLRKAFTCHFVHNTRG